MIGRPTHKRLRKQHQGRGGKAPPPTLGGVAFSLSFWVVLPSSPLPCEWGCLGLSLIRVVVLSSVRPLGRCFFSGNHPKEEEEGSTCPKEEEEVQAARWGGTGRPVTRMMCSLSRVHPCQDTCASPHRAGSRCGLFKFERR